MSVVTNARPQPSACTTDRRPCRRHCFSSALADSRSAALKPYLLSRRPRKAGESAAVHVLLQYLYFFLCLGPDFLDNGSQPSLNGLPRNLHTKSGWVSVENLLSKIFLPDPVKTMARGKPHFRGPRTAVNWKRITAKRFNM